MKSAFIPNAEMHRMQQESFEFQQKPGFPYASPILLLLVLAAEFSALLS
jgi:hypothetical protein